VTLPSVRRGYDLFHDGGLAIFSDILLDIFTAVGKAIAE
jgi:hypothetical protein